MSVPANAAKTANVKEANAPVNAKPANASANAKPANASANAKPANASANAKPANAPEVNAKNKTAALNKAATNVAKSACGLTDQVKTKLVNASNQLSIAANMWSASCSMNPGSKNTKTVEVADKLEKSAKNFMDAIKKSSTSAKPNNNTKKANNGNNANKAKNANKKRDVKPPSPAIEEISTKPPSNKNLGLSPAIEEISTKPPSNKNLGLSPVPLALTNAPARLALTNARAATNNNLLPGLNPGPRMATPNGNANLLTFPPSNLPNFNSNPPGYVRPPPPPPPATGGRRRNRKTRNNRKKNKRNTRRGNRR